jgi:hypothetical protein
MVCDFFAVSVARAESNLRISLIGILKKHAAVVGSPLRTLDVAIELVPEGVRARAVAVHQVQFCRLVALEAVVKAGVRNPFSIWRDCRRIIRSFAVGERAQRAIGDAEFVNFRVEVRVVRLRMTVAGKNQILAVGSPVRARRAPFISAIGEVAVADLPRRAALRTHNEHLHEPGLEITHAVEPVHQPVVSLRRIRPLGSCGW